MTAFVSAFLTAMGAGIGTYLAADSAIAAIIVGAIGAGVGGVIAVAVMEGGGLAELGCGAFSMGAFLLLAVGLAALIANSCKQETRDPLGTGFKPTRTRADPGSNNRGEP